MALSRMPAYLSNISADRSEILRRILQLQPGTCPFVPHAALLRIAARAADHSGSPSLQHFELVQIRTQPEPDTNALQILAVAANLTPDCIARNTPDSTRRNDRASAMTAGDAAGCSDLAFQYPLIRYTTLARTAAR